jgi:hypothetical protein
VPHSWTWTASALTRKTGSTSSPGDEHRVIVYERDGTFARSWGEGFFTSRTHGINITPDDSVYCIDEDAQVVYKFTPECALVATSGTPGVASDTDYDGRTPESIVPGPVRSTARRPPCSRRAVSSKYLTAMATPGSAAFALMVR